MFPYNMIQWNKIPLDISLSGVSYGVYIVRILKKKTDHVIMCYNETCIKWPLNFVVSQDRWSSTAGRINMIW